MVPAIGYGKRPARLPNNNAKVRAAIALRNSAAPTGALPSVSKKKSPPVPLAPTPEKFGAGPVVFFFAKLSPAPGSPCSGTGLKGQACAAFKPHNDRGPSSRVPAVAQTGQIGYLNSK